MSRFPIGEDDDGATHDPAAIRPRVADACLGAVLPAAFRSTPEHRA